MSSKEKTIKDNLVNALEGVEPSDMEGATENPLGVPTIPLVGSMNVDITQEEEKCCE